MIGPPVESRAPPGAATRRADDGRRRRRRRGHPRCIGRGERRARQGGGRRRLLLAAADREDLELGRDAAARGGRRAADGDREVLLAAAQVERRPGRDRRAGLEAPEHLAVPGIEGTQDAVAAAGEAEPARCRRDAAALRLGGLELPDPLAGGDVDRADRAVVVPALEAGAEVPVLEPEEDVALDQLPPLLRRRQLVLDEHGRGLRRRVEDVVRRRVVRGRRVVHTAERRGEDRHRLTGAERRVLDSVDHLHALVQHLAAARVEGEPDAFLRGHRDDPPRLAADLRVVDERRLRDVVVPLVVRDELPPPALPAGVEIDRDQRVRARVRARMEVVVEVRRPGAGAEVDGARAGVDRDRRPDDAAADDPGEPPPLLLLGRDRPVRIRPGRRQVGVERHHVAAHAVLGAGRPHHELAARADRRARLRVAVVRGCVRDELADRDLADHLAVARPQRDELHVERRHEELAAAVGEAAVGGDAEVDVEAAVARLVLPLDPAGGTVEREDEVVVRRHVERAVDRERIRLLPAAHVGVDAAEVDGEDAAHPVDVVPVDLRQRRVAEVVGSPAEAGPVPGRVRGDGSAPSAEGEGDEKRRSGRVPHASTIVRPPRGPGKSGRPKTSPSTSTSPANAT